MHSALVRHVIFPLHERLRGRRTLAYLAEMERTQWLSPDALQALQWRKLTRLLTHATRTVPYYRDLFRRIGAAPGDIRTLADFQRLPVLTRDLVRDNLDALRSTRPPAPLLDSCTGGSSGQPLRFSSDVVKEARGNAAKLRARRWWGLDIGDKELDIWGNPVELSRAGKVRDWKDRALNLRAVSAYDLSRPALSRWVRVLETYRPKFLYVYPSALAELCRFLQAEGIDPAAWAPRYVISTAESLPGPDRELIERTLGARVVLEYGAHDGAPVMAHDCPCGRMHTLDDLALLEVTRHGRPVGVHELGELLVTSLDGYGMPFIRYAIGDLARLDDSRCTLGRGFGALEALEGRVAELLYREDGSAQSGLYLTGFFRTVPGVRQFQVVQRGPSRFVARLVVAGDFERAWETKIESFMRAGLGPSISVTCEYVEAIAPSPSGKVRWVINEWATTAASSLSR
ncbi:MAG: phenylacetate--CoA ligase family protein [Candidatus Rokubacteria bacterium]|nr:phenylacetate--CoA ligase family protein [Candidatus Rokubacteria bacterium]